jgi:hypothetical protein
MHSQNLAPVSKELGIVMLSRKVGFQTCPYIYAHNVVILKQWMLRLSVSCAVGLLS